VIESRLASGYKVSQGNGANAGVHVAPRCSDVERQTALLQLDNILNSSHIRTSKGCSLLLRYVVQQASSDEMKCLKERTLGVEVFDRDPHYDTGQDPVVGVAAGEFESGSPNTTSNRNTKGSLDYVAGRTLCSGVA
jgi:hypothetical protein